MKRTIKVRAVVSPRGKAIYVEPMRDRPEILVWLDAGEGSYAAAGKMLDAGFELISATLTFETKK